MFKKDNAREDMRSTDNKVDKQFNTKVYSNTPYVKVLINEDNKEYEIGVDCDGDCENCNEYVSEFVLEEEPDMTIKISIDNDPEEEEFRHTDCYLFEDCDGGYYGECAECPESLCEEDEDEVFTTVELIYNCEEENTHKFDYFDENIDGFTITVTVHSKKLGEFLNTIYNDPDIPGYPSEVHIYTNFG